MSRWYSHVSCTIALAAAVGCERPDSPAPPWDSSRPWLVDGPGWRAETGLRAQLDARGALELSRDDAPGLRVRTLGLARGPQQTPFAPGVARPDPSGALALVDSPLTAWWGHREGAALQGWTLTDAPVGAGPLRVQVGLEGASVAQLDDQRALLSDASGRPWRVSGLAAWDAEGAPLPARFQRAEHGFDVVVDDAGAVWPITVDPVFETPAWSFNETASNAGFGNAMAVLGRADGAAPPTLAVGAQAFESFRGRVVLFLQRGVGLDPDPDTYLLGRDPGNQAGATVVGLGDIDGDGWLDLAYGAPADGQGYVFVRFGASGGLDLFRGGNVDGFGLEDGFGAAMTPVGDLTGDGRDDLLVSANAFGSGGAGKLYVIAGAEGTQPYAMPPQWALPGDANGDRFGLALAAIPGAAPAGRARFATSAPQVDAERGRVYVYRGRDGASPERVQVLDGAAPAERFGFALASADLDGDGLAELIVGAVDANDGQGRVAIFPGQTGGFGPQAASLTPPTDARAFGFTLAILDDVNGDGLADLAVGAPFSNEGLGAAFVYHGGPLGGLGAPATRLDGLRPGGQFGTALAAGDIDRDGLSDLVVGAQAGDGSAYVYRGQADVAPVDTDGDGSPDAEDCAPDDDTVYPGAEEVCDGVDQDCDELADEGLPTFDWFLDGDGDSVGAGPSVRFCAAPPGHVGEDGDCDDADPERHPGAAEVPDDGVDQDCDGRDLVSPPLDTDGDGHSDDEDCAPDDPAVHPGAEEVCDGRDQDCDGQVDEDLTVSGWFRDSDGDGFGDRNALVQACAAPEGYVAQEGDCDDADPARNPDAVDIPNDGIDQDCQGGDADAPPSDRDDDGWLDPDDCEPDDPSIHPEAAEVCDGRDQDCDEAIDEGLPTQVWYIDSDGDGFGQPGAGEALCGNPEGRAPTDDDCDDADPSRNPEAAEIPDDGIDQDCDGRDATRDEPPVTPIANLTGGAGLSCASGSGSIPSAAWPLALASLTLRRRRRAR